METIMIISAIDANLSLGIWFLPVILIVVFATVGFYIYRSLNSNWKEN